MYRCVTSNTVSSCSVRARRRFLKSTPAQVDRCVYQTLLFLQCNDHAKSLVLPPPAYLQLMHNCFFCACFPSTTWRATLSPRRRTPASSLCTFPNRNTEHKKGASTSSSFKGTSKHNWVRFNLIVGLLFAKETMWNITAKYCCHGNAY